ncbi:ecotin [Chryseobacterium sp. KLBC 52]|uniref:ecotin n=1 Tax=Chryseobacterium sp. KLBC 52 TaxID=1862702 RepID=UPI001E2FAB13|nr:ecotin [Chryseobacterium sp. KLBC 52]
MKLIRMKNKKLHELSKKITQNKLLGADAHSIRTITGGNMSLELLPNECGRENECWGYGGTAGDCSKNECWYFMTKEN